jgi:hypothetical protein
VNLSACGSIGIFAGDCVQARTMSNFSGKATYQALERPGVAARCENPIYTLRLVNPTT